MTILEFLRARLADLLRRCWQWMNDQHDDALVDPGDDGCAVCAAADDLTTADLADLFVEFERRLGGQS